MKNTKKANYNSSGFYFFVFFVFPSCSSCLQILNFGSHKSSNSRAGSSSASLIATSDSTASRPSMMRWSYDCAR